MEPFAAKPLPLHREYQQALAQFESVLPSGLVLEARSADLDHAVGPALAHPQVRPEQLDSLPAITGPQNTFLMRYFRPCLSTLDSLTGCLILRFSSSRAFNRLASVAPMPPTYAFHR